VTLPKAILIALLVSCASAALVAFVSRTPASVRTAPRVEADPSATGFTDDQVARHGAFRGPLYLAFALGLAVQILLLVLLLGRPMSKLASMVERIPGGWPVRVALIAAAIAFLAWLVSLPVGYVRGYALQKAWGLSTQDSLGWFVDQAKGVGISLVIAAIAALAFFGIVRWQPRVWWLVGAAGFTALTAVLVFLYPVAIAPVFNRFTPLDDAGLEQRIQGLASEVGVRVDEVLVADASRRSTAENAYVAGLGATKQVVLYDTLLANGDDDQTMFVVAHELGHEAEKHVLKNVGLSALGLLVGFAALAWLVTQTGFLNWAGAEDLRDPRLLPALLLFATVAGLVVMPIQNAVSRSFESTADRIAFRLVDDPAPAVGAFRRLALSNLADLRPHPLAVWLLYSHPPIADRIEAAQTEGTTKP
jgi:STE24 endopeptidase